MVNGKIVNTMAMGGSSTGDQRNFGLVTTPPLPSSGFDSTQSDGMSGRIASSLPGVPRDQANLEAEKGETVLTDMNNDGNFELYSIGGNRHHSGGTPLNLPPQSFIYSDTSKMKLDKYELSEMGITSKKKLTPAKVSRGYELNKFIGILDDEHSDNITIDTAEYMLNKNKKSLSQLAFLQEAKKQFEDGVPLASYAYLTEKGMDPLQFSQQVEQISAQEAEQKMMMQLPYEQRLEMMMAKEQAQQQQAAMQQQQMMAQQQQQMGAPQGGQQGGPMHQMPDGSMMPGQSHGQEPQGMPPQGMMPPQPPMQQPMAMGKRGGQMSNLYKAQFGMDFMNPPAAVQDNTYVHPSNYMIPSSNEVSNYDQVGMLEDKYLSEDTKLLHLQPETIMANYVKDTEANLRTFQNQQQFNLNSYGQSYQSGQNPDGFSDGRNQFDPEMVDFWEDHIKNGGTPPSNPSIEYTEAYKRVYPGQVPEEVGNVDADPSEGNDPYSTSYFAPPNNNEEINNQGQNITFAKGINTNPINTGDNSEGYDASGSPLNYSNTDNPYYVGADWQKKNGGGLPKAQYNVSDNVFNQNPIVHASESTGVYTPPEVDIVPFEENYVAGQKYNNLISKYNPEGVYMNLPTTYDPGTIDQDAHTKQMKSMAMRNPIASIGVGLGAAYDSLFGSKYGGSLPKAQNGNLPLTPEEQILMNLRDAEASRLTNANNISNQNTNYTQSQNSIYPNFNIDPTTGGNRQFIKPNQHTNLFSNSPYVRPNPKFGPGFEYGGSLPKAQYGLKDTGELAEEEFTINAGNTTRPDISTSVRNFNSEEDMFYHNATGFDNVNVQKYTGMNFGLNPIAAATGVPFGFTSGTDRPVVDRSNNLANFDLSTGINVGSTEEGDRTRAYAEGRGGLGWGMGNNWSRTFPNSASNTSMRSNTVHYLNPYLSGNAGLDFGLGNNESIGLEGTLNTSLSPYGKGLGANVNFKKGNFGVNAGIDDMLNNPQTTFGASYSFDQGGELSMAKRGKEINYNGETYNEKEMKRLKNSKDPAQVLLYREIMNGGPIKAKPTIDDVPERQNTEGTSSETTRIGGSEDWATNYLSDEPGAQEYRDGRYEAYVARRGTLSKKKQKEEPILGPQEYHNAYAQFQEQNAYFEKNLSQEERNTEIWDNGTNDQYIKSLEGSGMSPLLPEFISHVQSGYIGGEALKMMNPDDDITTYIQSGLDDQTVFGKAISPEDGMYGNTTNDERESTTVIENTPGEDCTNAAEMSTACDEAGGTWTPWDPETKTGCECSEKIIPPPPIKPPETPDAEFWLQDKMGIANAMDNKMSLKKYYPWAPEYNLMQIDPVFKDPTREIAAIGEQAVIAADTASSFAGPQRAAAVQAKAQGVAGKQIADAINKVQSDNVNIANTTNVKNAELEYKTQVLNNDSSKTLYDNTMLTEQNYDNALRESNAAITKQLQNAYTNRANTSNLNSIYPNFNIDPTTGGMIDITNPKAFYAQDNYVDPVSARDQYAKDYNYLIDKGVDPKKIPVYTPPNNKNRKTNAQNNEQVITGGYQQDGTSTGKFGRETRNNRLLKKGRALRNWFSPLRGN